MRYWGGGISQALMHAIGEVRRQYPAIFYYCEFLDDYHDFQYRQRSWLPETRSLGSIDIRYTSAGADISGRWLALDNGHKIRHARQKRAAYPHYCPRPCLPRGQRCYALAYVPPS